MKYFLISVLLINSLTAICQSEDVTFMSSLNSNQAIDGSLVNFDGGNYSGRTFKAATKIEGDKFLFDNWFSSARVITQNKQVIDVRNVNFDMERGTFSFKEGEYLLDVNQFVVGSVSVNDLTFKRTLNPQDNISRLMEVIYESDDISLLKDHNVRIREGKFDIQVGQEPDEYVSSINYYLISDGEFKKFKPKKSSVLAIFNDYEDIMVQYVKDNKLSYKEDSDLKKMFIKLSSLRSSAN
ncbi:hypothetical protein DCS32_02545 [Dokdonia sp. Dokd-P16]|uniref:hypothetical protein n=1 Tax=Dokdonia sp. Dokd-P16 TaxID=2173169 RepID=UPI000D5435DD|nr:hypothetical protein [Dokdonia sp. Dokd-P16]AWH73076.1 hypothetical protein DCS32_02545 [Dokdonia sp. Dokd-P16]